MDDKFNESICNSDAYRVFFVLISVYGMFGFEDPENNKDLM